MKLQQIMSLTRRALDDYEMIKEGDKIAIGISGGKDSLALLYAMHGLMRFYPKKFEIYAVTVDLGFLDQDTASIQKICEELGVPYKVVKTDIGQIVFDERKESSPCSLCSKMRKGALNNAMKELGCNKIAYAHHKDDVIITMMMSMIFEGRFHTFSPVTYLERADMTLIRPFIYMDESDIIAFVSKENINVLKSPCPADGNTKREYCKQMLHNLMKENPGVKERLFTAIIRNEKDGWKEIQRGRKVPNSNQISD